MKELKSKLTSVVDISSGLPSPFGSGSLPSAEISSSIVPSTSVAVTVAEFINGPSLPLQSCKDISSKIEPWLPAVKLSSPTNKSKSFIPLNIVFTVNSLLVIPTTVT